MSRVRVAILVLAAACTTPKAKVLAMLGEPCSADADCGSMSCPHAVCSRPCAVQGDCPAGFDCSLADPADAAPTWHAPTYDTTQPGGFGTDCATVAGGCTMDPSPCAAGFHCVGAKCDADAICSAACATDADCPPALVCGTAGSGSSAEQVCLARGHCDPCLAGACAPGLACSPDGTCLRPCAVDDDCPHAPPPASRYLTCTAGLCTPAACDGGSPIATGTDVVCSPCRDGHPEDCGTGLLCFRDDFSREQFCTEGCTVTVTKDPTTGALTSSNDTCPTGSSCAYGGPTFFDSECTGQPSCSLQGGCGADPAHTRVTCYP
jgi:hypothetical protein